MARIKNTGPKVRRRNVAVFAMLVSFCLIDAVIFLLLNYKSQGLGLFKSKLEKITDQFEEAEQRYKKTLTDLTSSRTPVSDYNLTLLDDEYSVILESIPALTEETNSTIPAELAETIAARRKNIDHFRVMNKTIQWEEIIGTQLIAYDNCIKKISYRDKASKILSALAVCKVDLATAQAALVNLPEASSTLCKVNQSPTYLIQKKVSTHELFVNSYTLTSKNKAKEAASADMAYQKALDELDRLPDWNICLTNFLQAEAAYLTNQE